MLGLIDKIYKGLDDENEIAVIFLDILRVKFKIEQLNG